MKPFSRAEVLQSGKFLLGIAVLFFALSWAASLVPTHYTELFYASASLLALKAIGFTGWVTSGEPALITLTALKEPIGITWLCTGILETEVLAASILASSGTSIRKRLAGTAIASAAVALLNITRIVASILAITWLGLDAGNFSHDVLFRAFLFAAIAGLYYTWLTWATTGTTASTQG